jgi:DMSO reductase anchor subunit
MKKAKKVSLSILIAALVIFALTVGLGLLSLMMEELMTFAIVSLVLSILVGLAAIYPIATVWSINRR